jgi:hypothetical protein
VSSALAGYVAVSRAAADLGVSAARVRELIAAGRLDAVKHGRDVFVSAASVRHRRHVVRPAAGRPMSPRMAWALLWLASGRRPGWVSSAELVRLRGYLRSRSPDDWPRLLARRADVYSVRMLAGDIERLRQRYGVSAGGIVAAADYEVGILPSGDEAEFYVPPDVFEKWGAERRMKLNADKPNVTLRVPLLDRPELLADPVMPAAVVAADLLESGGERSANAGRQLLLRLGIGN